MCVQFVQSSYAPVLRALEPSLTVKTKDELATLLVTVFHSIEAVRDFLVEIVMDEVANDGNLTVCLQTQVIFRSPLQSVLHQRDCSEVGSWSYLGDWPTWAIGLSCGERPAGLPFNRALALGCQLLARSLHVKSFGWFLYRCQLYTLNLRSRSSL